jgi:hypothetical protein
METGMPITVFHRDVKFDVVSARRVDPLRYACTDTHSEGPLMATGSRVSGSR